MVVTIEVNDKILLGLKYHGVIKTNIPRKEMDKINQRLHNNNFVEKAPSELIDKEKTNFNNLEKDVKKIQLTLENL